MNIKTLETTLEQLVHESNRLKVWVYLLNRNPDGEYTGGSRFGLDLTEDFRARYFEDILKSHQGADSLSAQFEDVREYRGQDGEREITWLPVNGNSSIASTWTQLKDGTVYAEGNWLDKLLEVDRQRRGGATGVYICEGNIGQGPGFLLGRSPLKKIKFGGFFRRGKFVEVEKAILTLPTKVDAIHLDGKLFFLSGTARDQLVPKAEIAAKAAGTIEAAIRAGGLSDENLFREVASSGHNPRRMMQWNSENYEFVKSSKGRAVRRKFQLSMEDGKLKIGAKAEAERLIKLVTERGMLDPFTDGAREVSSAKAWR